MIPLFFSCSFFFFNDTATTEIYTLSLHDALPIYLLLVPFAPGGRETPGSRNVEEGAIEAHGHAHPLRAGVVFVHIGAAHAQHGVAAQVELGGAVQQLAAAAIAIDEVVARLGRGHPN